VADAAAALGAMTAAPKHDYHRSPVSDVERVR
jgi:hypothetical protein